MQNLTGGLPILTAQSYVKQFFQNTYPTNTFKLFQVQPSVTEHMRYILVDWLIEVSNMKEFSSSTLHCAIRCVDKYLMSREVPRSWLQLLGIACLVLCTR